MAPEALIGSERRVRLTREEDVTRRVREPLIPRTRCVRDTMDRETRKSSPSKAGAARTGGEGAKEGPGGRGHGPRAPPVVKGSKAFTAPCFTGQAM